MAHQQVRSVDQFIQDQRIYEIKKERKISLMRDQMQKDKENRESVTPIKM